MDRLNENNSKQIYSQSSMHSFYLQPTYLGGGAGQEKRWDFPVCHRAILLIERKIVMVMMIIEREIVLMTMIETNIDGDDYSNKDK